MHTVWSHWHRLLSADARVGTSVPCTSYTWYEHRSMIQILCLMKVWLLLMLQKLSWFKAYLAIMLHCNHASANWLTAVLQASCTHAFECTGCKYSEFQRVIRSQCYMEQAFCQSHCVRCMRTQPRQVFAIGKSCFPCPDAN